jgi:hypothetical protein
MLKLLTITILLNTSLFATKQIDETILKYEKKKITSILKRQKIELNDVSIALKKDLKQNNWYGYVFNLTFTVKGEKLSQKDTLFTNGKLIAPELINIKTKRSFKDELYPKLGKEFYKKENLIAGDVNAKHTLVLFSDPLCPICVDEVPFIIKKVMDNPKKIALYYYNLPLQMHPTAKTLSKASMIAHKMGIEDVEYKLYSKNFGNIYDAYAVTDQQLALNYFNKEFNTKITMEQINDPKLEQKLQNEMDMSEKAFVSGTPTLFLDGEIDKSRMKYEEYLK